MNKFFCFMFFFAASTANLAMAACRWGQMTKTTGLSAKLRSKIH